MKIAELYAELGFKIEGADQLKAFDALLKSVAQSARNVALALKVVARTQLPKNVQKVAVAAAKAQTPDSKTEPPADTKTVAEKEGIKSLSTFVKQLVGVGSVAYGLKALITAIGQMVKTSLAASFGLERFTMQTGLSRDELKRWEMAAAKADVSQQEIQESIAKLTQQATEIPWGQHLEQASAGAFLGVNMLKRGDEILQQFGARMQGKSFAQARMFGEQLGISPNVAYMMWRNGGRLPNLPAGQGLTNAEQAGRLQAETALNQLAVATSALKDRFVAFAIDLGLVTKPLEWITNFIRGYNLLMSPAGRPANWPLPRTGMGGSQTTVGPTTVNVHINESNDPQRTKQAVQRAISDASYQRPPAWAPLVQ